MKNNFMSWGISICFGLNFYLVEIFANEFGFLFFFVLDYDNEFGTREKH